MITLDIALGTSKEKKVHSEIKKCRPMENKISKDLIEWLKQHKISNIGFSRTEKHLKEQEFTKKNIAVTNSQSLCGGAL